MNIEALFKISYGLYVVSTSYNGKINGHIVNTISQITADPIKVSLCTSKDNFTCELIQKSKVFSASILSEDIDLKFIGPWGFKSGRDIDKFNNVNYKTGLSGSPILLDKSLAYLDCKVIDKIDVGSHILFIAEVLDADIIKQGVPLTYSFYRDVIKGKSPKNAPTFVNKKNTRLNPDLYKCTKCGWVYDIRNGEPSQEIAAGTKFNDLPDNFRCPICGALKDKFVKF